MSEIHSIPITSASVASEIHHKNRDALPVWVVYNDNTTDFTGQFISRMFLTLAPPMFGVPSPTSFIITALTINELRSRLPRSLVRIPRHPLDDPNILETWI